MASTLSATPTVTEVSRTIAGRCSRRLLAGVAIVGLAWAAPFMTMSAWAAATNPAALSKPAALTKPAALSKPAATAAPAGAAGFPVVPPVAVCGNSQLLTGPAVAPT
ncbi:MAG: hypothetical protein M3083_19135, partial [Actinomycetota bacterium]|nr:hypothetical protein [Actinomycetota bacterium]